MKLYDSRSLPDRLHEHIKGLDLDTLVLIAKEMNLDMRGNFSMAIEAEGPEDMCDKCCNVLLPESHDTGTCSDCGHSLDAYCKCFDCGEVMKKNDAIAFTRASETRYACEACYETVEEKLNAHIRT